MTKILASVRNEEEAQIVLNTSQVGVIDMKEPSAGALGALKLENLSAIHKLVNGQCATSATIGDLPPQPDIILETIKKTMNTQVDYVKVGIFGSEYLVKCLPAISTIASKVKLIGVLFADEFEHLSGPCEFLKSAGFYGAMIDTANKDDGSVFDISRYEALEEFVITAKRLNMLCGIAGSLKASDIEKAMALNPDYIGFRSALCINGKRNDQINSDAIHQIAQQVAKYKTCTTH